MDNKTIIEDNLPVLPKNPIHQVIIGGLNSIDLISIGLFLGYLIIAIIILVVIFSCKRRDNRAPSPLLENGYKPIVFGSNR